MNETEILSMLERLQAVITHNHVVYTSGKHGSAYVNKDALYPHTRETSQLCRVIAQQFSNDGIDVVVAPVIGGVILSQWIAYHLCDITGRNVLGTYAEKEGDGFVIKRGYDKLIAGKKTLVVEDILTTGGSARKVIELVRQIGGDVAGLGALCNRGGITPADVANPPRLFSLLNVTLDAWDENECPMCAKGVPVNTDVGKGRQYLAGKNG